MSDKTKLERVIASRELDFVRATGETELTIVSLGEPIQPDNEGPWYCPYEIRTPSFKRTFAIAGEDAMQALILATHVISSELEALASEQGGRFEQYGGPDTGFPHWESIPRG